jgi:hypothetical protein
VVYLSGGGGEYLHHDPATKMEVSNLRQYNTAREDQKFIQKIDPSSRQKGRPRKTIPQLSMSNKYLVMSYSWDSTPRLTDLPSIEM